MYFSMEHTFRKEKYGLYDFVYILKKEVIIEDLGMVE